MRDPPTALRFAREANTTSGNENPSYLHTLSLAYHLTGDRGKAVETLEKAIALLPEQDSRQREKYERQLSEFRSGSDTE